MALLAAVGCEDMIVTDDMVIMCHASLMLTGRVVCLADKLLTSVTDVTLISLKVSVKC